MTVTKIKMRKGKDYSWNPLDIEGVYFEKKYATIESVYDYLKVHEDKIFLSGFHNVYLVGMLSSDGRKYIRSMPNSSFVDNLFKLPKV